MLERVESSAAEYRAAPPAWIDPDDIPDAEFRYKLSDASTITLNAGSATATCTQANAATKRVTVGPTVLEEGTDFDRGASDNDCATNLAAAIDALDDFSASATTNVVTLTNGSTTVDATSAAILTTDDATAFALAGRGYYSVHGKFYASISALAAILGVNAAQTTEALQLLYVPGTYPYALSLAIAGHQMTTESTVANSGDKGFLIVAEASNHSHSFIDCPTRTLAGFRSAGGYKVAWYDNVAWQDSGHGIVTTKASFVYDLVQGSNSASVRVNGTHNGLFGDYASTTWNGVATVMKAGSGGTLKVYEFIGVARSLTAAEIAGWNAYVRRVWGTP